MINMRAVRRLFVCSNSCIHLSYIIIAVLLYIFLLQIVVDSLSQVFSLNNKQENLNNTHKIGAYTFTDTKNDNDDTEEEKEFDILDYKDELSNDVRFVKEEKDFNPKDSEIEDSKSDLKHQWFTHDAIIERTKDCSKYFQVYPVLYSDKVIRTYEESNLKPTYSLAFSHLVHNQLAIYEAFLSMYFRPNDFYCIHVDIESHKKVWMAIKGLVKCYSTKMKHGKIVLIDKKDSFKVRWGQDQMLKADLKCIEKLLYLRKESESPWRYSISMAGSELPLVTYASLHSILSNKLTKDDSALESFRMPNYQLSRRLKKKARINCKVCPDDKNTFNKKLKWKNTPPLEYMFINPLDNTKNYTMQVFKGLRSVILSAKDADFMVNHPVSKQIYKWFENI